jgi:hypothetical protein
MRALIPVTITACVLLSSACSSSSGTSTPSKPATPVVTSYGEHAMQVGAGDPSCKNLHSTGPNVATGGIDTAECTLMGAEITFYAWTNAADEADGDTAFGGQGGYFTTGTGWSATIDESDTPKPKQLTIATQIADALSGKVVHASE